MKRLTLFSTLFFFINSISFGGVPELRPWTQPDDILLTFKQNHMTPLGAAEYAQIEAFKAAITKDVSTKKNTHFVNLLSSVQPAHKKALMTEIIGCRTNITKVAALNYKTEALRLETIEGLRVNLTQKLLTFVAPLQASQDNATKEAAAKAFIDYECEVFAKRLNVLPDTFLTDLKTRGFGFRLGHQRTYSDDEREFAKASIEHLHLLKFLVLLNLDELGLDDLPDNLAELTKLNILNVRKNNFTHIPQAIHDLQSTNRIFLDFTGSNIPSDELDPVLKKSSDLLWESNVHSLMKFDDLEWGVLFDTKLDSDEDELEAEDYAFAPLVEIIALAAVDGHEAEHKAWLNSPLNALRFKCFTKSFSPHDAIQFFVNFPEQVFIENLCGKTADELKKHLVCVVLDHLREAELIKVTGEERLQDDKTIMIIPQIVQGWSRFFTREPIEEGNGAWLTEEGVQVLFNAINLLGRPCHADMTRADVKAFRKFEKETKMPFVISEDVRFFRSVGIRRKDNKAVARGMSAVEKAWVKKHIDRLPELPFLKYINLGGMEYKDAPDGYDVFRDLRVLFLYGNNVETLTPKIRDLFAKYPALTIDLQRNPVIKGYETLTTRRLMAYQDFVQAHGEPPENIKNDICVYKTIGVHEGLPMGLSVDEKAWVKAHLEHLPKLNFLQAINLSHLGIKKLPKSFEDLCELKVIWLQHNEFTKIPIELAKIHARNQNLVIELNNNPLYKNANKRFQAECEKEHKKYVLACEQRRIDSLKAKHTKPNVSPKDLVWHPELIKRLGLGPLKEIEQDEYVPRQNLVDYLETTEDAIQAYEAYLKQEGLSQSERKADRKELKGLRKSRDQTKARLKKDEQQFEGNEWKYIHIFFELMMRDAEVQSLALKEGNVDLPVYRGASTLTQQNQASSSSSTELTLDELEERNAAWIKDPFHKIMLYTFLCTHSPEDFIKFFMKKQNFLTEMLKVKRAREEARAALPEIYDTLRDESKGLNMKKLEQRTEMLFSILLSVLGPQGKYIPIITTKKGAVGVEMQHYGWQPYLTHKPDLDQRYKGWYKGPGLAEILLFLDLAALDENDDNSKGKAGAEDDED